MSVCVTCETPLGTKYYQAVPGVGDLCLSCHREFEKGEEAAKEHESRKRTEEAISRWKRNIAIEATAVEREACARIADKHNAAAVAAAIRERGGSA